MNVFKKFLIWRLMTEAEYELYVYQMNIKENLSIIGCCNNMVAKN